MDMRRFIRHPAGIPIEIRMCAPGSEPRVPDLRRVLDVSLGGIAFQFFHALERGSNVLLRIPSVRPVFESVARVVWCRPSEDGFTVGVEFLHAHDEFRARMVEQVCQIETYRQRILKEERRALSADDAAREWITKFADQFPLSSDGQIDGDGIPVDDPGSGERVWKPHS
jgi:hypothetical protein